LQRSTYSLAGFKGPLREGRRGREGRGTGGKGEEGRVGGKENGGEGRGRERDLPDQCEIASFSPAAPLTVQENQSGNDCGNYCSMFCQFLVKYFSRLYFRRRGKTIWFTTQVPL